MKMKKMTMKMAMPYLKTVDEKAHTYLTTQDDNCSVPPAPEEHYE